MLIEAPYKTGDTVSLKLTSGEEIVGRLEEETDNVIRLSKPLMLTASQQGVGLAPFMFTVNPESKFTLNKNTVTCVVKTEKEMASQYITSTSGLAVN